jgi:uncharacterized membrane protein YidH (DUF202 family)
MDLFATKIAYADFDSFLSNVNTMIVNPLIGFLFALAIAFFLYGVLEFLMNQENEEKKTSGKSHMLWGVIGIFIMMSVWGILTIALNTIGIPDTEIEPEFGHVNLPDYIPSTPNNLGN